MHMVILSPVEEPKSYDGVKFTAKDYAEAKKRGDVTVPMVTAREAIRNSKGLYRLKADPEKVAKSPVLPDPQDMTNPEIYAELQSFGKAPRKKMNRKVAQEFLRKLREEAVQLITDDEDDDGE